MTLSKSSLLVLLTSRLGPLKLIPGLSSCHPNPSVCILFILRHPDSLLRYSNPVVFLKSGLLITLSILID